MFGLVIAVIYSGIMYFVFHTPLVELWPTAASILWYWYILCAVVMGIVFLVISFLVALGLPLKGLDVLGPIGALLGVAGTGIILLLLWGWYLLKYAALLYGVHLLSTWSGGQELTTPLLGGALIIFGILLGGGNVFKLSSSSSSSSLHSSTNYRVRRMRNHHPGHSDYRAVPPPQPQRCPHCGSRISPLVSNCPQCGAPQN